jgi:hypothetical protein
MSQLSRQQELLKQKQTNSIPNPRVSTPPVVPTRSSIMINDEVLPGIETIPVSYNDLSDVPATFTPAAHTQAWSTITATPTTLAGYGITDNVINIAQVEIDFGSTPIDEKSFTITNSDITLLSYVVAQLAYDAPTDKELDELEFDVFDFRCVAGVGSFVLHARSLEGYVADKFKVNYIY